MSGTDLKNYKKFLEENSVKVH